MIEIVASHQVPSASSGTRIRPPGPCPLPSRPFRRPRGLPAALPSPNLVSKISPQRSSSPNSRQWTPDELATTAEPVRLPPPPWPPWCPVPFEKTGKSGRPGKDERGCPTSLLYEVACPSCQCQYVYPESGAGARGLTVLPSFLPLSLARSARALLSSRPPRLGVPQGGNPHLLQRALPSWLAPLLTAPVLPRGTRLPRLHGGAQGQGLLQGQFPRSAPGPGLTRCSATRSDTSPASAPPTPSPLVATRPEASAVPPVEEADSSATRFVALCFLTPVLTSTQCNEVGHISRNCPQNGGGAGGYQSQGSYGGGCMSIPPTTTNADPMQTVDSSRVTVDSRDTADRPRTATPVAELVTSRVTAPPRPSASTAATRGTSPASARSSPRPSRATAVASPDTSVFPSLVLRTWLTSRTDLPRLPPIWWSTRAR